MEENYQSSGSWVYSPLWCPLVLLLSLLLQPFLSLAVLVPGENPCHAHPRTRKVELVAQFDQGVVFPQNLHHFHLDLWEGVLRKGLHSATPSGEEDKALQNEN